MLDSFLKQASERVHDGGLARMLLNNPLVQEFFIKEREHVVEMFKRLPMGTTIEVYQFVQAYGKAIDSLENSLRASVATGDIAHKNLEASETMDAKRGTTPKRGRETTGGDPFRGWFDEDVKNGT